MATRSNIGMVNRDGSVRSIYCHYDGYVEGVGYMLQHHYRQRHKVDELLDLGDISVLERKLNPDDPTKHNFNNREKNVTVAYGRDRGETGTKAKVGSLEWLLEDGKGYIEYVYIFNRDGEWEVYDLKHDNHCTLNEYFRNGYTW